MKERELNTTLGDVTETSVTERLSDTLHRRVRNRYIQQGLIKPSEHNYRPGERPFMSPQAVAALKQKLIDAGLLVQRSVHAFQKRSPATQVRGTSGPRKDESGDFRRMEQRDAKENTRTNKTQKAWAH